MASGLHRPRLEDRRRLWRGQHPGDVLDRPRRTNPRQGPPGRKLREAVAKALGPAEAGSTSLPRGKNDGHEGLAVTPADPRTSIPLLQARRPPGAWHASYADQGEPEMKGRHEKRAPGTRNLCYSERVNADTSIEEETHGIGLMSTTRVLRGVLKSSGRYELEEKPVLPAGPVRATVEAGNPRDARTAPRTKFQSRSVPGILPVLDRLLAFLRGSALSIDRS